MFLKKKKRISELINTITEMIEVLPQLSKPDIAINNCLVALAAISLQLNQEEDLPQKTMDQLKSIQRSFNEFLNENRLINGETLNLFNNEICLLQTIFQDEVRGKLNIVFFPYKASMWDSLESIYEA